MSHPESDGVGEMVDGAARALSTTLLRVNEIVQRRREFAIRTATAAAQDEARAAQAAYQALAASDRVAGRNHFNWVADQKSNALGPGPVNPVKLFPYLDANDAQSELNRMTVNGDNVAYLHAYAQVLDAQLAGAPPLDSRSLHRDAAALFADTEAWEMADIRARAANAEALQLAELQRYLATNAPAETLALREKMLKAGGELIHLLPYDGPDKQPYDRDALLSRVERLKEEAATVKDRLEAAANTTEAEAGNHEAAAEHHHDSAEARADRAAQIQAQGFSAEATEAAILHDLSFGVQPSAAVTTQTRRQTRARTGEIRTRSPQRGIGR